MDIQIPDRVGRNKKKKRNALKTFVLVFLAFAAVFCVVAFTPVFDIKVVEITGTERIDLQLINDVSGIHEGDNLMFLSKKKVSKKLGQIPYVHEIKIVKKFPKTVEIQVTESKPKMLIPFVTGYIVLDENSKVLEAISDRTGYENVVLKGVSVEKCVLGSKIDYVDDSDSETIDEIKKMLADAGIFDRVTQIDIKDKQEIYLTIAGSLTAKIGNMNNFAYKCRILASVLDNIANPPKGYVDLTSTDNVFYKENYAPAAHSAIFNLPSSDVNGDHNMPVIEKPEENDEGSEDDNGSEDDTAQEDETE